MTATDPSVERQGGGRRRTMTVARIARLAGVSAPTVSRVLNGQAGVALATRQRVEELLRVHGYQRPDSGSLPALEVVIHALDSPWAVEIINGVEQAAREHQVGVLLTQMQGRLIPGRAWTEQVIARRPTGVVAVVSELTAHQQSQLATRSIPLVVLDTTGEPLHDTPSVGATNWSGGLTATRHLLELGHRRIAMLCGPTQWPFCRARLDGFRAAMDAAGVPVDPDLVRVSTLYVEGGRRDGAALLRLPEPPTAIVTTNDLQAMGVYQAAWQVGLRIPDELSVVGFDDVPFAEWSVPPLTTIRQPLARMGATAANLVLAMAHGERPADNRIELSTSLVVRQSTAPPRPVG